MLIVTWPWLIAILVLLLIIHYHTSRYYRMLSKIPASKAPPLIGHAFDFYKNSNDILDTMLKIFKAPTSDKNILAVWAGPMAFVYLQNLEDIEKLLSNNINLRKSVNYSYLKPWLGNGLINSDGAVWHSHRKLITPSFHFKILEGFLETMRSKLKILFEKLDEKIGKGYFDIEPYIANFTLDIIAETAMSTTIEAQQKQSKFVDAIKSLTEIIIVRSVRIWYFYNFMFYLSPYGNLEKKCVATVNDYIKNIMEKKRREGKYESNHSESPSNDNDVGEKKRLALLDMLFEVQAKNPQFSDKEILDEVNTFMFAGYDTTTSGITFLLYSLSVYQDIQEKVYAEIKEILGDKKPTYQELMSLKYLERVLKESLRLYPSVPYIGRQLKEDLKLSGGFIAPAGSDVAIFIYHHHRNPEIWSDPEKFDPDRFLPENCAGRHPYAYIPFSAGSRNCIGQKFAMMEMMLTATELIRHYKISVEPHFKAREISHIVLRLDEEGVKLKLEKR